MNREMLLKYLQEIYGNRVYNLDSENHLAELKKKGWIFEQDGKQINKPDFLVLKSERRVLLIELKKIKEKQSDLDIKEGLERREEGTPYGWWAEPNRKDLERHVKMANKQFKGFVKHNISQFVKDGEFIRKFSTILALCSERIMQNYTLPDIIDDLYGIVKQVNERNSYPPRYKVRERLLNIKKFKSIGLIAVWDGIEKFLIYNNLHTWIPNNVPFFMAKKDKVWFILDEYFSELQGIRILLIQESNFDGRKENSFLINERHVNEENFFETLYSEIKFFSRVQKEQKKIFDDFFKQKSK